MDFYFRRNQLISSPSYGRPIDGFEVKRGDAQTFELHFDADIELTNLEFGCRKDFSDGNYLVFADTFTGDSGSYTISPDFGDSGLSDMLGQEPSLLAIAEFAYSVDGGANWLSSQTLKLTIANDIIKD